MTPDGEIEIYDALVELKRRRAEAKGTARRAPATTSVPVGEAGADVVAITDPDAYVAAALERIVAEVAGTTTGGRNAAAHKGGQSVGRIVGAGLPLDKVTACEAVLEACRVNGHVADDGEKMAADSIRSGYMWGVEHPIVWEHVPAVDVPAAVPFELPAGTVMPTPPAPSVDAYRDAELAKERIRREVRRILDMEESSASFVRVGLKRGDEFLAEPDPPITWAIEELAQVGHNVLLTAQYKTGKTTFLLNLARAVADGVPFLDHFETSLDLGNIAMLDYELGEAQYRRWLREIGVVQTRKVLVGHWRGVRGRFDDERNVADLVEQLATFGVGVAVIDPFAAAAKGVDENDNGAVGAFLNLIDHVKRESGVHTVVLATHTGRREADIGHDRARGATRLDDWPDVRWLLTKGKDDDDSRYFGADGRDVTVPTGALKYTEHNRRYTFTGQSPGVMRARALEERIIGIVANSPGINVTALRKAATARAEYVDAAVERLRAGGYLLVTENGPGKPKLVHPGRSRSAPSAVPFSP